MSLDEMLQQYEGLLQKKEELAEATKKNNQAIEEMKKSISDEMVDLDCVQQACGDYMYSLQNKTIYSKLSDEKLAAADLDFFDVLREQGFGDLIKETVNQRSLNSAMNALAEENDGELPDELAEVLSVYDTTDIARRKLTAKQRETLRKAKENMNA